MSESSTNGTPAGDAGDEGRQEGRQEAQEAANDGKGTDGKAPASEGRQEAEEGISEAGRRAIETERRQRKAAEKALADLRAELETARAGHAEDLKAAVEKAVAEARADALAEAERRMVEARIVSRGARLLADPEDATRLLDLDALIAAGNGKGVTDEAISKAIEDLIKAKPYLAATATPSWRNGDQGPRGGAPAEAPNMNDLLRAGRRRS